MSDGVHEDELIARQPLAGGDEGLVRTPPAGAEPRVLVVDHGRDFCDYVQSIFGPRWRVESAVDARQALEAARRDPPDLVLSDERAPGAAGPDLLAGLRKDPRTRTIPVILFSSRAGQEATALDGADSYLVGQSSALELIARVSSRVALSIGRRERAALLEREQAARREAELHRQHLFSLFMQAPTPIAILRGPDYVIEFANPPACQVSGRSYESLIDRPLFEAFPELAGFRQLLDGVLSTGEPYQGKEVPVAFERPSGTRETVYFNFVCAPLRDVRGNIDGVLAFAFDVSDEVMAREQMNQLRSQAEAASRAKDEFLAMLSHELRNPLSPMVTALQLMRLRSMESHEQDVLERQVRYLTRLVDDLLDVAAVARGKVELRRQNIELWHAVGRALEITAPLLEQRRQLVDIQVPSEGLSVHVDPDRMAQVVANLLTNAAKYSEPGSRITVEGGRKDERVWLRVRDEGAGIAPEMLGRIFDLFVQQSQTLDRSKGGLGLGLAIVKGLVALHGGTVMAASEGAGKGSEFTIELPAADSDPALDQRSQDLGARQSAGKKRVLVVDDNADAAEILKEALELLGYDVAVAHDGPSALSVARKFEPEIALLDIGLPVMDGYELARRLREEERFQDLHLVAVTGYGQDADRERSAQAGFERHLVKPVDLTKLEQVIQGL